MCDEWSLGEKITKEFQRYILDFVDCDDLRWVKLPDSIEGAEQRSGEN